MMCVNCGGFAEAGSAKHPYCVECFRRVWFDDYDSFFAWLNSGHLVDSSLAGIRRWQLRNGVVNGDCQGWDS